jgi:hypothetical protein
VAEARYLDLTEPPGEPRLSIVAPPDFTFADAGEADARLVLDRANVSLYCLDPENRRALFAETDPAADLIRAPFLYHAQHQAARRLVAVPYDLLHELADEVPFDPERLTLIYSTGRCGSTLVSRALSESPGVLSLSEPDVFTQLVILQRTGVHDDNEIRSLLRSCTLLQCAPAARRGEADAVVIKFRSFVIHLAGLYRDLFPEAKIVFLYRNADAWFRSTARTSRAFEPDGQGQAAEQRQKRTDDLRPLIPLLDEYLTATNTAPPVAVRLISLWASSMHYCLRLLRAGTPMFLARYEELQADPRAVLSALCDYCSIPFPDADALAAVLTRDSQEGSLMSRARARQSGGEVPADAFKEMHDFLAHWAPELSPDIRLPGTFSLPERP